MVDRREYNFFVTPSKSAVLVVTTIYNSRRSRFPDVWLTYNTLYETIIIAGLHVRTFPNHLVGTLYNILLTGAYILYRFVPCVIKVFQVDGIYYTMQL